MFRRLTAPSEEKRVPISLPYVGRGAVDATQSGRARGGVLLTAVAVLTVVACVTCVRIEVLNQRAGGVLPRREEGKWRVTGTTVGQQMWRHQAAARSGDPTFITRPLTPVEDSQMRGFVAVKVAEARLRDVVGTWGLLQYPLVPIALFCCLLHFTRTESPRQRVVAVCCLLALLICSASILGRAYFTSLGW